MAEEAVMWVGDRRCALGKMVTTPSTPSPRTYTGCGVAARTAGKEVGQRRENGLIGGGGEMK